MKIVHDSRDLEYRIPFGAAETGTDILISIKTSDCIVKKVFLEVRRDDAPRYQRIQIALSSVKSFLNNVYSVKLNTPAHSCLIWYRFRIIAELDDGIHTLYYCNNRDRLGGEGQVIDLTDDTEYSIGTLLDCVSEDTLPPYQITVYKRAEVPEWYKNGIVYQIFPDRFARDKDWRERCEEAVKFVNERRKDTKRIIQDDWSRPAYYERDDSNRVTGWPIYGGSLNGIREKLGYLKSLGVSVIYLNPIFKATSNHRYDTGNYMKIDRALGTEADFVRLAAEAKEMGIRIVLDGVFSHTGADSIYFDRYGNYGGGKVGAYQSEDSPYRSWYKFDESEPCGYRSWWGVEDLPEVDENNEDYRYYMLSEDGVAAHWLRLGASGWRLDVADELPDRFIRDMRDRIKRSDRDNVLIGEVWEDASNKISYGERRAYFSGDELDSTMNYPLRSILLDYINYTDGAGKAGERIMSLAENYPEENFYGALNLIGSHDRERILTMMAADKDRGAAVSKVKILSALQYALPGVPCIYYGDEAGLTGGADPENRSGFPWGREDPVLEYHYRMLGLIYREHPVLKTGRFLMLSGKTITSDDVLAFMRYDDNERILVLANRSYGSVDVILGSRAAEETDTEPDAGKAGIKTDAEEADTEPDAETLAAGIDNCNIDVPEELKCRYAIDLLTAKPLSEDGAGLPGVIHMDSLSVQYIYMSDIAPETEDLGRSAGVICPLSSLGSDPMGQKAEDFVDYIAKAGFGIWQVLPVNPPGLGDSPYVSSSTFAGAPQYVSERIRLKEAAKIAGYDEFLEKNDDWLTEYIAYTVIKEIQNGLPWYEWPNEYKYADPHKIMKKLLRIRPIRVRELEKEQYLFYVEWKKLRMYAHSKGVRIMGDIPIYMGYDSADVWANRDIFQLDEDGGLKVHAGVPPDYFSKDGQDWGNPLYDWDKLAETGYGWWMRRIRQCAERFDILRIDHFRGLSEYYAIPEGRRPADGSWQRGPGLAFVRAIKKMLKTEGYSMKLVAEDLGQLDAGVFDLTRLSGIPGMNVWQFDVWEMMNMPEDEALRRVFYTGTHDNNTIVGFVRENADEILEKGDEAGDKTAGEDEAAVDDSAGSEDTVDKPDDKAAIENAARDIIRKIYKSPAALAMVQLQDVFMLSEEARMNVPGVAEGNWSWKIPHGNVKEAYRDADERAKWFRELAEETGRI